MVGGEGFTPPGSGSSPTFRLSGHNEEFTLRPSEMEVLVGGGG
jgi:hypothetical protein